MDHLSFFRFHNRYITFFYDGERDPRRGVVVDSIPYNEKKFSTQYTYIRASNMPAWKDAETRSDKAAMRALEEPIDILKIKNPSLM